MTVPDCLRLKSTESLRRLPPPDPVMTFSSPSVHGELLACNPWGEPWLSCVGTKSTGPWPSAAQVHPALCTVGHSAQVAHPTSGSPGMWSSEEPLPDTQYLRELISACPLLSVQRTIHSIPVHMIKVLTPITLWGSFYIVPLFTTPQMCSFDKHLFRAPVK